MNTEGGTNFKEVLSDSESDADEEDVVDLTAESDEDNAPRKRAKLEDHSDAGAARPKWSNPDPYTALPPPEAVGGPKKDIVQVIRKAKVDAGSKIGHSQCRQG